MSVRTSSCVGRAAKTRTATVTPIAKEMTKRTAGLVIRSTLARITGRRRETRGRDDLPATIRQPAVGSEQGVEDCARNPRKDRRLLGSRGDDQTAAESADDEAIEVEERETRPRRRENVESRDAQQFGELGRAKVPAVPDVLVVRAHGPSRHRH